MIITDQTQIIKKEYNVSREELKEKLGIVEDIDHIFLDGQKGIGIVTKWVDVKVK